MKVGGIDVEASMTTMVCVCDVGGVTMVAVVGFLRHVSGITSGCFVAVKSEVWRRGRCADDDSEQVICSVVFHDASLA